MKRKKAKDIESIMLDGNLVDRALARAARQAIAKHKKAGVPLVYWENGRVVFVNAKDVKPTRRNGGSNTSR